MDPCSPCIPTHTSSLRVGAETRMYISGDDISEYCAVNALKDDKYKPAISLLVGGFIKQLRIIFIHSL